VIPRDTWDWTKVPPHLQPTYRVLDEEGAEQARGKDLDALKAPLEAQFDAALAAVADDSGYGATGQVDWTFGELPIEILQRRAGHEVLAYPAVLDEGETAGLGVFGSAEEAAARHRHGVRRLLLLAAPFDGDPTEGLDTTQRLGLVGSPYASVTDLLDDLRAAILSDVVDAHPAARTPEAYAALLTAGREALAARAGPVVLDVLRILADWRETDRLLSGRAELVTLPALQDMREQVARLVGRGFLGEAGADRLRRFPTYLLAVRRRREQLDEHVARDRQLMDQVRPLDEAYLHQVAALQAGRPPSDTLRRARWMLEEYRISLFAQQLGTDEPVSDQRIRKQLAG
jgi:ATP-dependent helicase HrpA